MKRFAIFTLILLTVPLMALAATSVLGGRPFGGAIVMVRPCYNFSALQVIVGPPTPGSYIYQMGASRSYLNGPPFHPGQWLLGMLGGSSICDIDAGESFNGQGGTLIRFHGSSL